MLNNINRILACTASSKTFWAALKRNVMKSSFYLFYRGFFCNKYLQGLVLRLLAISLLLCAAIILSMMISPNLGLYIFIGLVSLTIGFEYLVPGAKHRMERRKDAYENAFNLPTLEEKVGACAFEALSVGVYWGLTFYLTLSIHNYFLGLASPDSYYLNF